MGPHQGFFDYAAHVLPALGGGDVTTLTLDRLLAGHLIRAETDRRAVTVHVLLDFVHVAEYVWAAAHAFHKPGTTEAEAWAADRLTAILAGQAARSADEMTAQADRERLPASRRGAVTAT